MVTLELTDEEARQMLSDYLHRNDDARFKNEWIRDVMLRLYALRYPAPVTAA